MTTAHTAQATRDRAGWGRNGRRWRRGLGVGTAVASAALMLAACGSGSPGSGTASGSASTTAAGSGTTGSGTTGSGTTGGSSAASPGSGGSSTTAAGGSGASADLAYVQSQVAKYSKLPTFKAPGAAFNAKKVMAGKAIFSIPVNSSDQFVQVLETDYSQVAKMVGFKFVDWRNQGKPSEWVRGMDSGVSQHASLIDLLAGIDPKHLAPQISQAKAAKIPVVASDAYGLHQPTDPALTATMNVPYGEAGTLMADWTTADSKGHADVLVIGSSDVAASPYQVGHIKTAFTKYCPGCKVKYIDIPVADWASQTQSQVQAALSADPNLDYVLPVYDSQSQFIVPAIKAAGRDGKVHIVTYDGTAFVLKMMEQGNIVAMDVGENLKWVAWAIADQEMRVAGGLKPVPNENTPLMIFTKKNVSTAGTPPKPSTGYGNAYVSGYEHLWGLK
ncbi:MAG: sugar ABC transporter substrate-binding protein [Acidimicrobiales bacterium]